MQYEVIVTAELPTVMFHVEAFTEEEAEQEVVARLNHHMLWWDVFECNIETSISHNEGDEIAELE